MLDQHLGRLLVAPDLLERHRPRAVAAGLLHHVGSLLSTATDWRQMFAFRLQRLRLGLEDLVDFRDLSTSGFPRGLLGTHHDECLRQRRQQSDRESIKSFKFQRNHGTCCESPKRWRSKNFVFIFLAIHSEPTRTNFIISYLITLTFTSPAF